VIAVQVTDLARAQPERELAAPARSSLDAGPRRDLFSDLLARCAVLDHDVPPCSLSSATVQVELMLKSRTIDADVATRQLPSQVMTEHEAVVWSDFI
jgi:hypothetical protein